MDVFTDAEVEYLKGQTLGRLATVGLDGGPHVAPVGVFYDPEARAIVIGGHAGSNMAASKKFRDARRNPEVAFVVDDLASVDPWSPRFVEIRGRAETHVEGGEDVGERIGAGMPFDPAWIRISPRRIVTMGIDGGALELNARDVAPDGGGAAKPCAAVLRAIRSACPGIPISLSTSAAIEPDPERRHALVASWTEIPDLVTANTGEEGILELCELLVGRGIGIEASLLSLADANAFVTLGIAPQGVRAMVEPLDPNPHEAAAHAETIEQALTEGGVRLEQVHHGDGIASWAVNRRAVARGHGIRSGLEDTPVLPDGRVASGNGELVAAAASLLG